MTLQKGIRERQNQFGRSQKPTPGTQWVRWIATTHSGSWEPPIDDGYKSDQEKRNHCGSGWNLIKYEGDYESSDGKWRHPLCWKGKNDDGYESVGFCSGNQNIEKLRPNI